MFLSFFQLTIILYQMSITKILNDKNILLLWFLYFIFLYIADVHDNCICLIHTTLCYNVVKWSKRIIVKLRKKGCTVSLTGKAFYIRVWAITPIKKEKKTFSVWHRLLIFGLICLSKCTISRWKVTHAFHMCLIKIVWKGGSFQKIFVLELYIV